VTELWVAASALQLDLAAAADPAAFAAWLDAAVVRALPARRDAPVLIALPEHVGLLALFAGARGRAARDALAAGASSEEAFLALAIGHGESLGVVAARFPDAASPGQLLHLAATDTLVRWVLDPCAALARRHGVWLTVCTAVPRWERRPPLGDDVLLAGDAPGEGRIAVATRPEVLNRNHVFAPDGRLVAVHDKAYLVPDEREPSAGLGLRGVELDAVTVAALPMARVASVISKDAWMPDVNERLDQLRAEVLLQPEAFDRWDEPARTQVDDVEVVGLWPPDNFRRGGWWMVQRHRSFRANVTPVLVGALADLRFDGQALVAVPAPAGIPGLALHGQDPLPGWAAVGPWPVTGEAAGAAVARLRLPERCDPRAPVPAGPGLAVADPSLPRPLDRAPPSVRVAPGGLQLVPDLVALPATGVTAGDDTRGDARESCDVALAWVEVGRELAQGAVVACGDGRRWCSPVAIAPRVRRTHDAFDRQWRPRLTVVDGRLACAYLAFTRESWDLEAAVEERTCRDVGPGGQRAGRQVRWRAGSRIDDAHREAGVLRERLHDAPLLLTADAALLVAVWSDLRWPHVTPEVRLAWSADRTRRWSSSRRVDGQTGPTRGQTAPTACLEGRSLLVAWQELAAPDDGGRPAIWLRRLMRRDAAGAAPDVPDHEASAAVRLDHAQADRGAYRPHLAVTSSAVWALWEEDTDAGGGGLVARLSRDGGASWSPARHLDPALPGLATQRRASTVGFDDQLVVVVEDDRGGPARILVGVFADPARTPSAAATGPRWWRVDDAPDDADARSPTAVRCDGDVIVVWQDTREGADHLRSRRLPLTALLG
jgi:predicted amidohydrolase